MTFLLIFIIKGHCSIIGQMSGSLNLLLNVPVSGMIVANARGISISAAFDLQKDQNRQAFLRTTSCSMRAGFVNAQVTVSIATPERFVNQLQATAVRSQTLITAFIPQNTEFTFQHPLPDLISTSVNIRYKVSSETASTIYESIDCRLKWWRKQKRSSA